MDAYEIINEAGSNDPELLARMKYLEQLQEDNDSSYRQLQADKGFSMDTTSARVEQFLNFLTEIGIVSPAQRVEFEISFQTKITTTLEAFWKQVRDAEADARKKKLLVSGQKSGLIVPGR